MTIDHTMMGQIISTVFDEMLGMPTSPAGSDDGCCDQNRIIASIRISGSTEQLVVVEAPAATACLIGETMFDAEPGTLPEEEIQDAVGEVVNMIGGNVKGIYDGDSTLSLPCVSRENGRVTEPQAGERAYVHVAGSPLLVRWHDMTPSTVATQI